VRSSRRSSTGGGLTVVALLIAGAVTSAHRRDEYLQAARLAIDPGRVELEMDLTPGIAVADNVLDGIDVDRDGAISAAEGSAYAARLLNSVTLDVDGRPLPLVLATTAFPAHEAVSRGEGTIRIRAGADLPGLSAGVHRLRYRNTHRSDIGVYLANALVPVDARVTVTAQRRDVDQRELVVEYVLGPAPGNGIRWVVFGLAGALFCAGVAWRRHPR